MFAQESILYRLMHQILMKIVADLPEESLTQTIPGTLNPPAFILSHLALCNDYLLKMFGQEPLCPVEWEAAFGPGSDPQKLTIPYPARADLISILQTGHDLVLASAPQANPRLMERAHAVPILQNTVIKTVGDCAAHLLATHFAFHIGQLSVLRRMHGHAPIF